MGKEERRRGRRKKVKSSTRRKAEGKGLGGILVARQLSLRIRALITVLFDLAGIDSKLRRSASLLGNSFEEYSVRMRAHLSESLYSPSSLCERWVEGRRRGEEKGGVTIWIRRIESGGRVRRPPKGEEEVG